MFFWRAVSERYRHPPTRVGRMRRAPYALLVVLAVGAVVVWSFARKLDRLDRACLWRALAHRRSFGEGSTLSHQLGFVRRFLLVPFRDDAYFAHFTCGGVYGTFVYDAHPALARRMNSKLFWSAVCARHGVPHPTLVAVNARGALDVIAPLDPNAWYLRKADSGMGGVGVTKVKGSEVRADARGTWIVQQLLRDCSGLARTFRFVTLHDGTRFVLWELANAGTVSNFREGGTGGTVKLCEYDACAALARDEQAALTALMGRLASLHAAEFGQIFSIGWDLMIDCPTRQSYVLEGNVCHGTWFYPTDVPRGLVAEFKRRCAAFHGVGDAGVRVRPEPAPTSGR